MYIPLLIGPIRRESFFIGSLVLGSRLGLDLHTKVVLELRIEFSNFHF